MTSKFLEETNSEFREFMEATPIPPPRNVQEKIFALVHQDLNPSAWFVFSKMALIHLLSGLITLSLCPQFGFRIFGEGLGIMKVFLPLGAYGCIALCGAFFVGISLFASGIILQPEELKALRNHRWLQISALTFLSLGALLMTDTEILFGFASAWVVGSILGGAAMLEFSLFVRRAII